MSTRRSALGRGLGALIPTQAPAPPTQDNVSASDPQREAMSSALRELPVELIDPNPEQPRRHFDADKLQSMAQSIRLHGVLQPIVVRRVGDRYELIVGERRWRASRAAGMKTIPAVVADAAGQARLEIAIVENVQRHDLNPMELAHAYRSLQEAGATQEEIGRKVSLDRSSVANHLRLLELSTELQEDLEQGRISMGHAKALLQVSEPLQRRRLRDRIVEEALSVRAAEQLGRQIAGPAPRGRDRKPKPEARLDADLRRVVDDLQRRYQARVQLTGGGVRGRIEIEYAGAEDLRRIASILLGDA